MGAIKTTLTVVPLCGLTALGWWYYRDRTEKDRTIAEQKRVIGELEKKLDRAWASELVADLKIDRVGKDAQGRDTVDATFVQYVPGTDKPELSKSMTLVGDEVYVDALVVQFDRAFVDGADPLKGKSMLLFRRAFGDQQKPVDGVPLFVQDPGQVVPERVKVDDQPGSYETKIWSSFWQLASDPDKAKAEGVRVAQGEAPHLKPVVGQVYKLTLRQSGGLEMTPRIPAAVLAPPTTAPATSAH
jgi:hypothetical protein